MHIALFGGSFDPPHLGHLQVVADFLRRGEVDAVWFVPVHQHPFDKELRPAAQRVAMLELLVTELRRLSPDLPADALRIEQYELQQSGPSYSFDTLTALTAQYPQHEFSWLIGSDNVADFGKWHRAEELQKKWPLLVVPRSEVSSTQARAAARAGQPLEHLVPPAIADYIRTQEIYAEK